MPREDEDDDFSDGEGDTAATVECPYCGEAVEITLDPGGGASQRYVQDCEVCCRPWEVTVEFDEDGHAEISVVATDE